MRDRHLFSRWITGIVTVVIFCATAVESRADAITNAGFETGDTTGWSAGGNVQILQATDLPDTGLVPPEGNYFALLSTGPGGYGTAQLSTLTSIPYLVTGGEAVISYSLNFLSSQPFADTPLDDYFQFNVLSGGVSTTLASGDVLTDIGNNSLGLVFPGGYAAAPDGTALTNQTGFNTNFVNLSAFDGQVVQFQFLVNFDYPPNFADSAILVDNISTVDVVPTPEPGSAVLLLAGMFACGTALIRKPTRPVR